MIHQSNRKTLQMWRIWPLTRASTTNCNKRTRCVLSQCIEITLTNVALSMHYSHNETLYGRCIIIDASKCASIYWRMHWQLPIVHGFLLQAASFCQLKSKCWVILFPIIISGLQLPGELISDGKVSLRCCKGALTLIVEICSFRGCLGVGQVFKVDNHEYINMLNIFLNIN